MAKLKVNKFILNDVRCFKGENTLNIRPLTFLVGANSTGKSTILGCFQAIARFLSGHVPTSEKRTINFNIEPYDMGGFTNIVRGAKPKNTEFKLGCEIKPEDKAIPNFYLQFTFGEEPDANDPAINEMLLSFRDGDIKFIFSEPGKSFKKPQVDLKETGSKKHFTVVLRRGEQAAMFFTGLYQYFKLTLFPDGEPSHHLRVVEDDTDSSYQEAELLKFVRERNFHKDDEYDVYNNTNFTRSSFLDFEYYSFAPSRAAPQRTYKTQDITGDAYGYDIPEQLRDIIANDKETWGYLKEQLNNFCKFADLFTAIELKNLGKSLKDPFQLEFKIGNTRAINIADAGYGISQVLPILVTAMSYTDYTFLLQHPEVYLYPKAQAALISILTVFSKIGSNNFIIETHNESLIQQARNEILDRHLSPEDISLIYLEKKGNCVEVYNLGFDKKADFMSEPPESYSDFYMP